MPQHHRGRNLVYVLTAWTASPRETLLKIDTSDAEPRHPLCD